MFFPQCLPEVPSSSNSVLSDTPLNHLISGDWGKSHTAAIACVVTTAAAAASPQNILGCIVWNTSVTEDGHETLYFGPLAVAPDAQGKGVGGFLVSAVESLAATLRATSAPKLRSVRYSFAYM